MMRISQYAWIILKQKKRDRKEKPPVVPMLIDHHHLTLNAHPIHGKDEKIHPG